MAELALSESHVGDEPDRSDARCFICHVAILVIRETPDEKPPHGWSDGNNAQENLTIPQLCPDEGGLEH
jgi:hypothetical protein